MENNSRYNRELSRSVTNWFHTIKYDSFSPEVTITMFSDEFLELCRRLKLHLSCSHKEFRKNMCEAICVMYIAHRQDKSWTGPNSSPPRPSKWTPQHEMVWKDLLTQKYFTYEAWQYLWDQIPQAQWESNVPRWRTTFELIAIHYIAYRSDIMVDCYIGEDTESVLSLEDNSISNEDYESN